MDTRAKQGGFLIFYEMSNERFEQYEAAVFPLLNELTLGEEIDISSSTEEIGSCIEYALCDLFKREESSRGFWVDGFIVNVARLLSSKVLSLQGYAWCAKGGREQWQIPTHAELRFSRKKSSPYLDQLRILVGDAKCGTLANHRSSRWRQKPEFWILSFGVLRSPMPPNQDQQKLLNSFLKWFKANSNCPIVDQDWQVLEFNQAIEYIRSKAIIGCEVTLEETWLDGGAAMRIV